MRLLVRLAVAGLLPVTVAATGQPQVERDTGSMIPVPARARIPETGDQAERNRIALSEFARCTVDRHGSELRKLVVLRADETDGYAWARLADNECLLSGQMRFKATLLRGAVFVELYRRRSVNRVTTGLGQAQAAPFVVMNVPASAGEDRVLQAGLLNFADCVIDHDRNDASVMVVARTASLEQNAALQKLAPFLGVCLPQGQQIKLARPVLEGAVAEVLYRGSAQAAPAEAK